MREKEKKCDVEVRSGDGTCNEIIKWGAVR